MNQLRRLLLAAAIASPLLQGCATDPRTGYSTTSTFPANVRSVQVPIFANTTSEPGHEALLTEAVIKELQARGFKVLQNSASDSVLSGTLSGLNMRRLSQDPTTGLVQDMALAATIDFEWRDARSGKVLIARRNFTASDSFAPARRAGEPIDAARHSAFGTLARDLVNELRTEW